MSDQVRRWAAALLVLVCGAVFDVTASAAELSIENVQIAYGPLGPVHGGFEALPGETLTIRFDVGGLQFQTDGKLDGGISFRLLDAKGKPRTAETYPLAGQIWLDVERLHCYCEIKVPDQTTPGGYTLDLTFTDNVGSQQASWSHALTVKPLTFAIVSTHFYHDNVSTINAAAGGLVGQDLYFQLEVVGEDRSRDRAELLFEMQVLDAKGKSMSRFKPVVCHLEQPDFVSDRTRHPMFSGHLALQCAGEFTLRITATDKDGGQQTTFETPFHVRGLDANETAARRTTAQRK